MNVDYAIFFPHVNWLFYAAALAILLLLGWTLTRKQLEATPAELADQAMRILDGKSRGRDVDSFEHAKPDNKAAQDIVHECLSGYGLPEEWYWLNEPEKTKLLELIERLRQLDR